MKSKMWWCYNRKIYDKVDNYLYYIIILYYINQRYRDDVIIEKCMIKQITII